jgi:hypothetical protein
MPGTDDQSSEVSPMIFATIEAMLRPQPQPEASNG